MNHLRFCPAGVCVALVATVSALSSFAAGQGLRADYERAARLEATFRDIKVLHARVDAHWTSDGNAFWYRLDGPDRTREYIWVDAIAGTRRPALDQVKFAAALAATTHRPVDPQRLQIDNIEPSDDGHTLNVDVKGKRWSWEIQNDALTAGSGAAAPPPSLPAALDAHPTLRTGEATTITFINNLKEPVNLSWNGFDGKRKRYATIDPGQRYEQNTYAGHVWIVTTVGGRLVAVFESGDSGGDAVIDDRDLATEPTREKPTDFHEYRGSISPDGKTEAFIRDGDLFLRPRERISGEADAQLTRDATADDAYEHNFEWSPDSAYLVARKTQEGDHRKVYLVQSSPPDQLQPKLLSYDYLKPGDRIPTTRLHLFDLRKHREIPISTKDCPTPWSVSDARWDQDSSRFTFEYNQRGHQVYRVLSVDAPSGDVKTIIDEESKTFFDYADKRFIQYLNATREIIWMSERDGWNHLYLYDSQTGKVKNQITRGNWVVRGVDRVDEAKRQIWFRAGGIFGDQDPYYVHYCRINFDGTGLVVMTAGDGTHTIAYSPDGRFIIDRYSRVDMAPVTELRRVSDGKLISPLEKGDLSELEAGGWKSPERFTAKGRDGVTDIYGVIYRPTTFDPARKYPVLEDIYAGPQDSFVPKNFSAYRRDQSMAELGFIVVQIDGMGTNNRSRAFHDVCWHNLGDSGFPDRILWIKAAAAKYPYIDATHVGIYGTSAGGQSALRALEAYGDFYKAAVADCGCHDNRMDKIWWNELWMGWPLGPWYFEQSNVTNANRISGKLLLIVGELDHNVDPSSTMQVVNALIKADKDFDLLVIPNADHGEDGDYGERRRRDFFVRNLLGVEPRAN
jgi:dipeptidyl-peptidase-4